MGGEYPSVVVPILLSVRTSSVVPWNRKEQWRLDEMKSSAMKAAFKAKAMAPSLSQIINQDYISSIFTPRLCMRAGFSSPSHFC